MKIIATRKMRLAGIRIEAGQPTEVSQADGELAIRNGWAVTAPTEASTEAEADAETKVETKAEPKSKAKAKA